MTDLERNIDPHCANGGEVFAQECVEHIVAAEPTLPADAVLIVVLKENVVSRTTKLACVSQCCR